MISSLKSIMTAQLATHNPKKVAKKKGSHITSSYAISGSLVAPNLGTTPIRSEKAIGAPHSSVLKNQIKQSRMAIN